MLQQNSNNRNSVISFEVFWKHVKYKWKDYDLGNEILLKNNWRHKLGLINNRDFINSLKRQFIFLYYWQLYLVYFK